MADTGKTPHVTAITHPMLTLSDHRAPPAMGQPANESDYAPPFKIAADAYDGLTPILPDGQPATLAILDSHGRVVASGDDVRQALFSAAIQAYRNFLTGLGFMTVYTSPEPKAKPHSSSPRRARMT